MSSQTFRTAALLLLGGAIALVLVLTLEPGSNATVAQVGDTGDGHCLFGLPCTIAHGVLFIPVGVGLAAVYASSAIAHRAPRLVLAAFFLAGCALAVGTELGQTMVDGRHADPFDALADVIGLTSGLLGSGPLLRRLLRD